MAARVSSISWFRKGFWKVRISWLFGYCFVILALRELYTSSRLYFYFYFRSYAGNGMSLVSAQLKMVWGFLLLLLCHKRGFSKKIWRERANSVFFISREKPQGLGVGLVFLLRKRSGHHLRKRDSASCVPNPSSQHRSSRRAECLYHQISHCRPLPYTIQSIVSSSQIVKSKPSGLQATEPIESRDFPVNISYTAIPRQAKESRLALGFLQLVSQSCTGWLGSGFVGACQS